MAFLLTVQICYAIIVTNINQNLPAGSAAVILKLSGSVMRIFQYTGFRKLIAVNWNLSAGPTAVDLKLSGSVSGSILF